MTPEHGVVVTLLDIWTQLRDLSSKMDRAISRQETVDKEITDHEGRIRALEKSRWPLQSVSIVIALASLTVAVVVALAK